MTDIERAQADGVDKGVAMDPTTTRNTTGRETTGREPAGRETPGRDMAGRDMAGRDMAGREPMAPEGAGRDMTAPAPAHGDTRTAHGDPHINRGDTAGTRTELFPAGELNEIEGRLRHALSGFVDAPRASVEEADHVLEDLAARLTETLAGRRRTLRTSWQDATEDTEQLRLALRDYKETAERLLRI
ncbi:hypothetical protein [Streptomyces sp. WG-D5]